MNRIKTAVFRNQQYHNNMLGQDFAILVRNATAKTVPDRDEHKNMAVIRAINDRDAEMGLAPVAIASTLRRRLKMDNPHKQYLAVLLTKDVLLQCARRVRSVYAELLYEIAVVSSRPSMPGTPAARKAKQAALEVLRGHDRAGAAAFRAATGLGAGKLQQEHQRGEQLAHKLGDKDLVAETLSKLERFSTVAKSHSDVFHDMLASSEPGQLEESLIRELMTEMEQMRNIIPRLIDKASNIEGGAAELALAGGMEALDAIEAVFKMYHEVKDGRAVSAKKRQQARDNLGNTPSFSFPKASKAGESSPRGIPPASKTVEKAAEAEGSQQKDEEDDDPFGLNALQLAIDDAATSAPPGNDPFAMSLNFPPSSPMTPTSPSMGNSPFGPPAGQAPLQPMAPQPMMGSPAHQQNFGGPMGVAQPAGYSPRGSPTPPVDNPFSESNNPFASSTMMAPGPVSPPGATVPVGGTSQPSYVHQAAPPQYGQLRKPSMDGLEHLNPFGPSVPSRQQVPIGQRPMGQPPMGQSPIGQLPMGQPPMGQLPMGQPPMGQPPMGQPPMGQPPMGQPPMGQLPMGPPPMGPPPMGQPMGQPPMQDQSPGFDEPPAFQPVQQSPAPAPAPVGVANWDSMIAERMRGMGGEQQFGR